VPVGKFASKEFSDPMAGFAKTGQALSISYSKNLSKKRGVSIDVIGGRNQINSCAFESYFRRPSFIGQLFFR
jgi:hypothetical protein